MKQRPCGAQIFEGVASILIKQLLRLRISLRSEACLEGLESHLTSGDGVVARAA